MDLLKRKELLIFDFDGTLADTSSLHNEAFHQALAKYDIDFEYEEIAGMSTISAMRKILDEANLQLTFSEVSELVNAKQNVISKIYEDKLVLFDGVSNFLRESKDNFFTCLATSGSRKTISKAMSILDIRQNFHKILCCEDVKNNKPNPEIFLKALEYFKISAEKALIFEDSESGIEAAIKSGIEYLKVDKSFWKRFEIK